MTPATRGHAVPIAPPIAPMNTPPAPTVCGAHPQLWESTDTSFTVSVQGRWNQLEGADT